MVSPDLRAPSLPITNPPLASLCTLCLLSVAPPLNALHAQAARPVPTPVPAVLSLSHATGALSFALPGEAARPEHRFPPFDLAWNELRSLKAHAPSPRHPCARTAEPSGCWS